MRALLLLALCAAACAEAPESTGLGDPQIEEQRRRLIFEDQAGTSPSSLPNRVHHSKVGRLLTFAQSGRPVHGESSPDPDHHAVS